MKFFSKDIIKKWDEYSIHNVWETSDKLMENAATVFFTWLETSIDNPTKRIVVMAGFGNNGGDALAVSRMLIQAGYTVHNYLFHLGIPLSADCKINLDRLVDMGAPMQVFDRIEFPEILDNDIIIDGLFGSGLNRPLDGDWAKLVHHINNAHAEVFSIDIPSGLDADKGLIGPAVKASRTLSFEIPKLCFFLHECVPYTGIWDVRSIGLDHNFILNREASGHVITETLLKEKIRYRAKTDDKSVFGFGQLCGGSQSMLGAVLLASKAAMKSGLGRLSVLTPTIHHQSIFLSCPPAMVQSPKEENANNLSLFDITNELINAIAIGPGLGISKGSTTFINQALDTSRPLILDADALNIISRNNWVNRIPEGSLLTPHHREFMRLFGEKSTHLELLEEQISRSVSSKCAIVLKGAYSSITDPLGNLFINCNGNPGMATAGAGDVLTGLLLSLHAQGYDMVDAALMGVFVHGLAGDLAARELGILGMNAEDIISFLPLALKSIYEG